ncbi:TP_methylase domain-containing protein [Haematococcus lacustris]|uniref:diphthine methyl ester synthase n=1 Tax=Haematococcus lacustris TaxID=44745 RepID=A0A699YAP2_HAELA|nr:TP_methylase domain-containing protein [Haematococcus lacustris]
MGHNSSALTQVYRVDCVVTALYAHLECLVLEIAYSQFDRHLVAVKLICLHGQARFYLPHPTSASSTGVTVLYLSNHPKDPTSTISTASGYPTGGCSSHFRHLTADGAVARWAGGLEVVKACSRVYLESYTSILLCNKDKLEALYGKEVVVADREMVEMSAETILEGAEQQDVAFLVVGDPFGATTHTDLLLRARELGIPVRVVHNASVMNAVGAAGLQLYRFGEAVSIVFFSPTWQPDSFYDRIRDNRRAGLHTLCLLDIKVKEPNLDMLARGRTVYEPPRYMTVNTAIEQLLLIESRRGEGAYDGDTTCVGIARLQVKEPNLDMLARGRTVYEPPRYMTVNTAIEQLLLIERRRGEGAYDGDTTCVGIARLQADDQLMVAGPMSSVAQVDFGAPLHCLVIAGTMHELEQAMMAEHGFDRLRAAGRLQLLPPNGAGAAGTADDDADEQEAL